MYAQKSDAAFKSLGIGIKTSTLGLGAEATTSLGKNFRLRAGLDFVNLSTKELTFPISDSNVSNVLGYEPDYSVKAKINFFNGHVLVDLLPMRNSIFHVTAGFYLGNSGIEANGLLLDEDGNPATLPNPGDVWPDLSFEEYDIRINNGNINAKLDMGKAIKPYFGLGLGRSLPKNRISFNFDLGLIYQGALTVSQDGREVASTSKENSFGGDIDKYVRILHWWPVVSFQLTYRIF